MHYERKEEKKIGREEGIGVRNERRKEKMKGGRE